MVVCAKSPATSHVQNWIIRDLVEKKLVSLVGEFTNCFKSNSFIKSFN